MNKKTLFSHLVENRDPNATSGKGFPINRQPLHKLPTVVETITPLNVDDPVGYTTGTGGTVTQATNKSTGVTLNKLCGQITMNAASLAANTPVSFTLTNSKIASTDIIIINIASAATTNSYSVNVTAVANGSCRIQLHNITAGALAEALVLNFAVIKSTTA